MATWLLHADDAASAGMEQQAMLRARNCHLDLPSGTVDYIRFGGGRRPLVMVPGVGDGLKTVRGMALPFALLYRALARDFTVYVFSRRRELTPGMTTRDMSEDLLSLGDFDGKTPQTAW